MFIQISARQSNACARRAGGREDEGFLFFETRGQLKKSTGRRANLQGDRDDPL